MEKKKAKSSSQPSALNSQQLDELREMLVKDDVA